PTHDRSWSRESILHQRVNHRWVHALQGPPRFFVPINEQLSEAALGTFLPTDFLVQSPPAIDHVLPGSRPQLEACDQLPNRQLPRLRVEADAQLVDRTSNLLGQDAPHLGKRTSARSQRLRRANEKRRRMEQGQERVSPLRGGQKAAPRHVSV